jgi:hypothetical protein
MDRPGAVALAHGVLTGLLIIRHVAISAEYIGEVRG